jgi:class 3 adenylate cyclase
MGNLRTTVILKTDIVDSTPRLAGQSQSEMGMQRRQHKRFTSDVAVKHHGSIFQQEGDAYLMEFPSVTMAVLAAMEMHQSLRSRQAGKQEKHRLAIRAVIVVGDILYQEDDSIGTTMSLTARIEKVTPPDEIYLSHAAWLILNKAEVHTEYVNDFSFKGFSEPEKVYRVIQRYRTRVLSNQYIINTDVRRWMSYVRSSGIEDVENFLLEYDDLLNEICDTYGGIIRNTSGDEYFITFSEKDALFRAMDELCVSWHRMFMHYQLSLSVTIHHGDINLLRSYLYGNDIHVIFFLEEVARLAYSAREALSIVVSGRVRENAKGTIWEKKFQELDLNKPLSKRLQSIVKDYGVYWLKLEDASINDTSSSR